MPNNHDDAPFSKSLLGRPPTRGAPRALAALGAGIVLTQACWGASDDWVTTLGVIRIDPRSSSGPLTVRQVGSLAVDQPQAGSGVESLPATTVTFAIEYFATEHLGVLLALGIPPTHKLRGTGTLQGAGVIGDGQQWSPAVLLKYHFRASANTVRPFLGVGVDYTTFRRSRITNDAFSAASYGPNARTRVSVNPSWNPLAIGGLDWSLGDRWSVGASIAYAPLRARITTDADNTSLGQPVRVTTDIRNRTVVAGVYVGYAWRHAP